MNMLKYTEKIYRKQEMIMKRRYERPLALVEVFRANEYKVKSRMR